MHKLEAVGPRSYNVVDDDGNVKSPFPQSRKWATRTMRRLDREVWGLDDDAPHPDSREV